MAEQEFEIENGKLIKYNGPGGDVVIPAGVTEIGDSAFSDCDGLTSITIPDSITRIGDSAFFGCIGLTSVTIPDSVTEIGDNPFDYCVGLTSIEVDAGNPTYRSENNCLIEKETKTLVLGCETSVIPSDGSVARIGDQAFSGCSGLTSVTIPDSVTEIGEYAFSGCIGLTSITIPAGVTRIGDYAFFCTELTSITIPAGVTSIGDSAFSSCFGLREIVFAGTKAEWDAIKKGDYWDYNTGDYIIRCSDGEFTKK